jgi:hypothetical protein
LPSVRTVSLWLEERETALLRFGKGINYSNSRTHKVHL